MDTYDKPLPREVFKRVLAEISDVNNDFFNLRTVIVPDPDDDVNTFYYILIPNDGAYYGLPLIGRLKIPETYPANPPIFHMMTKTGRYNVDIFRNFATQNMQLSSMCFDLLKDRVVNGLNTNYGAWKSDFTLSAVFSAIMQSLVSFQVPQMGGSDKDEFVTMEKLAESYQNVINTMKKYSKYIADIPNLPSNLATEIIAKQLYFPDVIDVNKAEMQFVSDAFKLQTAKSYVCGVDLSNLTSNYVFSVVLTNDSTDLTGRKASTILFRNGVTASAAIKTPKNNTTKWYYHGKPFNCKNLKLVVTITPREFTFAYTDETTDNRWLIHGDYPVCLLDEASAGNLKNKDFYLVLYFKRKSGNNNIEILNTYPKKGLVL